MTSQFTLTVNGQPYAVEVAPDTPLLYVLRNDLGLNGLQYGCGSENCGIPVEKPSPDGSTNPRNPRRQPVPLRLTSAHPAHHQACCRIALSRRSLNQMAAERSRSSEWSQWSEGGVLAACRKSAALRMAMP